MAAAQFPRRMPYAMLVSGLAGGCVGASLTVAGVALAALTALLITSKRLSWGAAALVVFAVLYGGVREVLPAYNDQFAVRGQLRRQVEAADLTGRPIVCYPSRYDSLDFYLRGVPVRVFGRGQKRELIAAAEAEAQKILANARTEVDNRLKSARHELTEYAGRLAAERAEQILRETVTDSDQQKLFQESLREVGNA